MRRHYTIVLLAAAAALGGCASQDPLALPDFGQPASSSSQQQYPGQGPYYGPGSTYGYGGYGYGTGYRQGYDPYYYDPYSYRGGYSPRYYSPGVVYVPYPVPCVDANGNGRCDQRPPKNHDKDGDGRPRNQGGGRDGDHNDVPPRYQRDDRRQSGDGSRLQRDVAPATRRAAPPPKVEREPKPAPRQRAAREDVPSQ